MSKTPQLNPLFFSIAYWKPFDEKTSHWESYVNYVKDKTLQKYNADIIGSYLQNISNSQRKYIEATRYRIENKFDQVNDSISITNSRLKALSSNFKILIHQNRLQLEQQKIANLLLHDIKEILRIPNSEKERQFLIRMGLDFFVKARKNKSLFNDSLEMLHRAEAKLGQDYFVLHRLGLIYLNSKDHLDVQRAHEYFLKAAKYASVENNQQLIKMAYLINDNYTLKKRKPTGTNELKIMASESFIMSAFTAYILGEFDIAVKLQKRAFNLNKITQHKYTLSKYVFRSGDKAEGMRLLKESICELPMLSEFMLRDCDFVLYPEILEWINSECQILDNKIEQIEFDAQKIIGPKTQLLRTIKILKNSSYSQKISNIQSVQSTVNKSLNKIN
jgi:hypothetical protein